MNFSFVKEIIFENIFIILRPVRETGLENLLEVAIRDQDLLQFSPSPIYSEALLKKYIDKAIENRHLQVRYAFNVVINPKMLMQEAPTS